ncbi:MAG TPA: hypothetical protein VGM38_09245 [Pseudolysinimonas sp.]
MTRADEELERLRQRAYGRQADIHLDSEALERLRELENERSPKPAVKLEAPTEPSPAAIDEPAAPEPETPKPRNQWIRQLANRLVHLRRSTVVIALAVIAFATVVVVVLTLVQRVQTDPLQVGAHQIARLAPDPAYQIPAIFGGTGSVQTPGTQAFQEFHGLRVVINPSYLIETSGPKTTCVSIYSQTDITDPSSTSFSGQFFSGCGAGDFPAMTQLDVRTPGLASDLGSAVAPYTALQFVYDKKDDEVVVFGSK